MTAFAAATAEWGVLIAADGRVLKAETGAIETDTAQKLFPIEATDKRIAYALAGSVAAGDSFSGLRLDLRAEFEKYAEQTRLSSCDSLTNYIVSITDPMVDVLSSAGHKPQIIRSSDGRGWKIIDAIFVGCDNSVPFLLVIEFSHDCERIQVRTTQYNEGPNQALVYGSRLIYDDMYGFGLTPRHGSRLQRFAAGLTSSICVSDARKFAEGYIEACYSAEGRALDPEGCKSIGGRVHVATIKPRSGFRWEIPPLSDAESASV